MKWEKHIYIALKKTYVKNDRMAILEIFLLSFSTLTFATKSHWCGYQPRWTRTTKTRGEFDWDKEEVPLNDKTMTYITNTT